jgi:hypothetical protein
LSVEALDKGILYVKLSGPIGLIKSRAIPVDVLNFELSEIELE